MRARTQTPGHPPRALRDAERRRGNRGRSPSKWGDARGGPLEEGNHGWPEQDPGEPGAGHAVRGIGSPLSHSARPARRPTPGPAVPESRVPQPRRRSDNPRFAQGEREGAPGHGNHARQFRRAQPPPKPRTNFASAAAPGRLSPPQAGCGILSQGMRGARGRVARTAGAPRVHRAPCAPSGRPAGTAGRDSSGRLQFPNPRGTSDFGPLPGSFMVPSTERNIKVKGPPGRLSRTGQNILATFPHLFWASSSPFHRNSNIFSPRGKIRAKR